MTEQDQDFDPAAGEDLQLELVLVEYAKSMDEAGSSAFLKRLKDDPDYYLSMGQAVSEMAMLIAGAAVIDDDAEFTKMRRRILFKSRFDNAELRLLRVYYLNNRNAVDMEAVLDGEEARKRLEVRLAEFHDDYCQQHPS